MNKISIKNMDGTMEQVDLVNAFKIKNLDKKFVILSKGEVAAEGVSKIYISEYVDNLVFLWYDECGRKYFHSGRVLPARITGRAVIDGKRLWSRLAESRRS